ncbi:MAG: iron transporter [Halieaceae bacterium]|nr:iron transporter [Halieaceae bacterium]
MRKNLFYISLAALIFSRTAWAETLLGIKEINPGISLTFEIVAKDTILPAAFYLPEKDTDIHVEMLAVWSDSTPAGSMIGGFVAYLTVTGEIKNQKTGKTLDFELTPHINLSDNLHYAQNIILPGDLSDTYNLSFKIFPPKPGDLGMYLDWVTAVGTEL